MGEIERSSESYRIDDKICKVLGSDGTVEWVRVHESDRNMITDQLSNDVMVWCGGH